MDFLYHVFLFLTGRLDLNVVNNYDTALIFTITGAVYGGLFIIIHFIAKDIYQISLFQIKTKRGMWGVILAWISVSGIVSLISFSLNLVALTSQSAAMIGYAWMYVISDYLEKKDEPEDIQE